MKTDFTRRCISYARAHGKGPEEMLEQELEKESKMLDFVVWNGARLSEWREMRKVASSRPLTEQDQDDYDAWLEAR